MNFIIVKLVLLDSHQNKRICGRLLFSSVTGADLNHFGLGM